jgi:hypothetical protein
MRALKARRSAVKKDITVGIVPTDKQHRLKAAVAKPPLGFATFCFRYTTAKRLLNLSPLQWPAGFKAKDVRGQN